MKTKTINLSLALLVFLSFASWAKSPSIPTRLVQKLNTLYPNARMVEWKENHGYEADFIVNNRAGVSMFNEKGELLSSRLSINVAELPAAVTEEVNRYVEKGYVINSAVQRWYKSRNFYDVEVKKGMEDYILRFTTNGRRISKINKAKQSASK